MISNCIDIEFCYYFYKIRFYTPLLQRFNLFNNYEADNTGDFTSDSYFTSKFLKNVKEYYYQNEQIIFNDFSSNLLNPTVFTFFESGELTNNKNNVFTKNGLYFNVAGNITNILTTTPSDFKYFTDFNQNIKIITPNRQLKKGDLLTPDFRVKKSTTPIVLGDYFKYRWVYKLNYFILLNYEN
jgi:hypothetical protein